MDREEADAAENATPLGNDPARSCPGCGRALQGRTECWYCGHGCAGANPPSSAATSGDCPAEIRAGGLKAELDWYRQRNRGEQGPTPRVKDRSWAGFGCVATGILLLLAILLSSVVKDTRGKEGHAVACILLLVVGGIAAANAFAQSRKDDKGDE